MSEKPRPPQERKTPGKERKKPASSLTVALGAVVFCIILTFVASSNSSTVETLASLGVVAPAAKSFLVIPGSVVGFNFLSIVEFTCVGVIVWGLVELLKTVGKKDAAKTDCPQPSQPSTGSKPPVKKEKASEQ